MYAIQGKPQSSSAPAKAAGRIRRGYEKVREAAKKGASYVGKHKVGFGLGAAGLAAAGGAGAYALHRRKKSKK